MEYRIPKDTAKLFEINGLQSKDIDNFSLRLNRFVRIELDSKDEYNGVNLNPNIDKNRVDKYYDSLEVLPYEQDSIFVKNDWKLTLGMGSGSVYNTSMTLHHIYGVPYLPAQSIKGAFRSYIIQNYFADELEKYDKYKEFEEKELFKKDKENKNYKYKWFIDIFGSTDQQGQVMFFDAFSKDFEIVKDIMTPHYGKYYGDKKDEKGDFIPPNDIQDPIPINFLAGKGASFKICFASKENYEIEDGLFKGKKVLEMIQEQLTDSLEVFGIGGKTSVGYGYFTKESEPKSPLDREWDIAKETKKPKILEDFIKRNSDSKYDELAKDKLGLLVQNIEDKKDKESIAKLEKEEGFSKLKSCTDLNDGLKIINSTLGKNPKFNSEQLDMLKEFYSKNKNKKKYAKGIYKKYDKWIK